MPRRASDSAGACILAASGDLAKARGGQYRRVTASGEVLQGQLGALVNMTCARMSEGNEIGFDQRMTE